MPHIKRWVGLIVLVAAAGAAQATTPGKAGIVELGLRAGQRCALHQDGAVVCAHESPFEGQLDERITYRPVRVVDHGATKLAVGGFASCAIAGGALDCWTEPPPDAGKGVDVKTILPSGVTDIAVGDGHACVAAHGAALCWGSDSYGQVGHYDTGSDSSQSVPWPVVTRGVTRVAAGGDLSCAIADGALWCWGDARLASDSDWIPGDHPPVRVFTHGATEVAAGSQHVCAIVEAALWCWGDNTRGQVGIGMSVDHARLSPRLTPYNSPDPFDDGDQRCRWRTWSELACLVEHPVKVLASGVTAVFARGDETCALRDGALLCWGANAHGQLGIDSAKDVLAPTVAIARGVAFVAPTRDRTCAVMVDGTLRCTRPCTATATCPEHPGYVTGDPTDVTGIQARTGIWRGTIGGAKVMACLERPDTLNDSQYYYLRHRFSISLTFDGGGTWSEAPGNRWVEGAPDAIWTLRMPEGGVIEGTWSSADGSRKLPIRLSRVADAGASMGAGCDGGDNPARRAFNAPRVAAQKLDVNEVGGYRSVSALDGHVSMTELPATMPHAASFNASMRAWFAGSVAGYYECAFSSSYGPDYNDTYDVELLSPTWLVARHNWSGYCGGAHPDAETDYTTWDLATGKTVSPWDFLQDSHWDYMKKAGHCADPADCLRRPPSALAAILVERFNKDNEGNGDCEGALAGDTLDYLQLHPTRDGLVFSTSFAHVIQACDEDIALTWKTLTPFLTRRGKAVMQSLQAYGRGGKKAH